MRIGLFKACIVGVLVSGNIAFPSARVALAFDESDAQAVGPDAIKDALLRRIRRTCATEVALRGVFLRAAVPDKTRIRLQGFVDQKEQIKLLEKSVANVLESVPTWQAQFPDGVIASDLKIIPVRSKYLKLLQQDFAASDDADEINVRVAGVELRPKLKVADVLRAIRLDDVYFESDRVVVAGVCINHVTFLTAHSGAQRNQGAEREANQKVLVEKLSVAILRMLEDDYQLAELKGLACDLTNIAFMESPAIVLQSKVVTGPLDAVLFQSARFDGEGTLVIEGFIPDKEQLAQLDKLVEETYAKDEKSLLGRQQGEGKRPHSLKAMRVSPWRNRLLQSMQGEFTKDDEELFRQTRLDRAYFAYSSSGQLELRFEGVCCDPTFAKEELKAREKLVDRMQAQSSRLWPELQGTLRAALQVTSIGYIPQPRSTLQPSISERPALDGVRIDGGAFFTKDRQLALKGLCAHMGQLKDLEALIPAVSPDLVGKLIQHGISTEYVRVLPTDQILKSLRQWSAANLDEVWVDRLFFDPQGVLTLTGFSTDPEIDEKRVKVQLVKALSAEPVGKELVADAASEKTGTQNGGALHVKLTKRLEKVGRRIQELAGKDPRLDGVLISRSFYDTNGSLVLTGLADNWAQKDKLGQLLKLLAADTNWEAQLNKGVRLERFKVVPLQPMVEGMKRVMPGYKVFDGILIDRVFHNAEKQLVVACNVVGDTPTQAAGTLLMDILAVDAAWQDRVTPGVAFQINKVIPRDEVLSVHAVAEAICHIKRCDFAASFKPLDTALLHDPGDSTAWYLRAMANFVSGDAALAERDLHRMVGIEKERRGFYYRKGKCRFDRTEFVQGYFRTAITLMEEDVILDAARGKAPILLVARP